MLSFFHIKCRSNPNNIEQFTYLDKNDTKNMERKLDRKRKDKLIHTMNV
jgi:hypothetical protein